ncbi:MAG: hypothetical protein MUE40_15480 [Anaerolineae bacterium]|nr:hypothetical protein [Anaerolineae bacterium]
MVTLEHCYYAQAQTETTPRPLARSAGISTGQAAALARLALLSPDPTVPEGTWALLRGDTRDLPFLMVQAQIRPDGLTWHVIAFPREVIAGLNGNLPALRALLHAQPPAPAASATLPPLELPEVLPLSTEAQVDSLLDLMTCCRNNTRLIEPLLSAVVCNVPLVILNAPADLAQRQALVQGLLTLLPASTRFNTTFASHLLPASSARVKIAFMPAAPEGEVMTYDWPTGRLGGATSHDDYSHYMVSQLRLDAELVTRQTEALTITAGWRFRSGDTLAEALAYASQRQRLDNALLTGQPVEADDVAKILADDPTLDDTLRRVYAEHLIRFSLAINDTRHTDPVAVTITRYPDLAAGIHQVMHSAVAEGSAALIFETLCRWLENPLSPQGPEWVTLLHTAALGDLETLIAAQDTAGIAAWLDAVNRLEPTMGLERISRRVIEGVVPLAAADSTLSPRLLLFVITHLPAADAQRLLSLPAFVRVLPGPVRRFLALVREPAGVMVAGALTEAIDALGDGSDRALLLFVDLMQQAERLPLLDTPALERLAAVAAAPIGRAHADLLVNVARTAQETLLTTLPPPAPRCVLQILLALGRYDLLARAILDQSRHLYGLERQTEALRTIQTAFARTPMEPALAPAVLERLEQHDISGLALRAVTAGLLDAPERAPLLRPSAEQLLQELEEAPQWLVYLPLELPLALLRAFLEYDDDLRLKRAVRLVASSAAAAEDKAGLAALSQMYKRLHADTPRRRLAFDLVRQYVRRAPDKPARRAVTYYTRDLGEEAGAALETAYQFSRLTGQLDFAAWALLLNHTAELLQTLAEHYPKKGEKPALRRLQTVGENLRLRSEARQRAPFAAALAGLLHALLQLAQQHTTRSPKATRRTGALISGGELPRSGVELLRFAGGHLARGRAFPLALAAPAAATPLGDHSPAVLQQHAEDALYILQNLLLVPADAPWSLTTLGAELDNLLTTLQLPIEDGRALVRQMALDCQRLAELIPLLCEGVDAALADDSSRLSQRLAAAQQEPRTGPELLRLLAGVLAAG